ncbi:MAG: histidine phosphatase family protein [Candidatus Paceibacterota bacterium]
MKHIYFIRHGETLKNRGRRHQGPDEPLTERGREQVREVSTLLQELDIDTLISSNYVRAKETADMISAELDLPYTIEPSVREFGRPLTLYGKHHYSFHSLRYVFDLYRHRMNVMWDKEGAENLALIRERISEARRMLEETEGERIAVVSHRIFMAMFTETVCYDRPLSLLKFLYSLAGSQKIPNTGMLHFTYESPSTWTLAETIMPQYNG